MAGIKKSRKASARKPVKPPMRAFRINESTLKGLDPKQLSDSDMTSLLSEHAVAPLFKRGIYFSGKGDEAYFNRSANEFEARWKNQLLFHPIEMSEAIEAITTTIEPGTRFNSYAFKHKLEVITPRRYVGNGEGMAAVLLLGGALDFGKRNAFSPNAMVYLPTTYSPIA